ncbi:rust resistance kinase Lr10-like [Ananas comosus]|uniref:Rust resistance kinase Lr10-like n=1 Tax=Ananas comosus TaxID=4615 RepID=A0A6P5EHF9_ANACO|nr:rust resistance kinase Lr10-like [Ananas comosus]
MLRLLVVIVLLFLQSEKNAAAGSKEEKKEIEEFSKSCPPSTCGGEGGPEIRFPFRQELSPPFCGAPGMELSCSGNTTILTLPNLGSYNVTAIDYRLAAITVKLPDTSAPCPLWNRRSIDLRTPIYKPYEIVNVILVSCSRNLFPQNTTLPTSCLRSGHDRFVYVFGAQEYMDTIPSYCMVTSKVLRIPAKDYQGAQGLSLEEIVNDLVVRREITLSWSVPEITDVCKDCEAAGKTCYFSISRNTAFCRHHSEKIVKLTTGTSAAAFVILLVAVITLYIFRKSEKEKETRIKVEKFLATYSDTKPTRYTFLQLKKMTRRFKVQLGQGGFGSVYKGVLPNGVPVAVKMLERSKGEGEEFINEVATIGRIHHVNVVRLLGFCSDGSRRALIYEFLPNESLEKYIFSHGSTSHQEPFRMDKLQEIAIGIARGIEYLHQGCDHRILHFDIKPHNILLDHHYNPKISDFGLAKLCSRDQSIVTMTAARGTMGYIAPEIYSRNFGTVSYKSDVYSFGMLTLELVSGKKIADPEIENQGEAYFPELVYEQLVSRQELELDIEMTASEEEIAKKLAIVALWCVQWNPVNRPTMSRTVQMLMGSLQDLEMPPKPFVPSLGYDASEVPNEV